MIKVRLIMATNPIIHHLQILAIWMCHIQTREHRDLLLQLPSSGLF